MLGLCLASDFTLGPSRKSILFRSYTVPKSTRSTVSHSRPSTSSPLSSADSLGRAALVVASTLPSSLYRLVVRFEGSS